MSENELKAIFPDVRSLVRPHRNYVALITGETQVIMNIDVEASQYPVGGFYTVEVGDVRYVDCPVEVVYEHTNRIRIDLGLPMPKGELDT